jgi:glucokinase
MTNTSWVVDRDALKAELSLSHVTLVNDFEAVAFGVAALPSAKLAHLFGPDIGLPSDGVVTVVGPGTGLGVAMAVLGGSGPRILPTEGGHVSYASFDAAEDLLLHRLREQFGRVSAERVVSGPGLNAVYAALGEIEGQAALELSDADLWARALGQMNEDRPVPQEDALADRALAQFFKSYGSVVGDYALVHLSKAIVLAGGLTGRMKGHPGFSAFHERFTAKGRYRELMCGLPVYYADHPEIGLFGAAAAGVA